MKKIDFLKKRSEKNRLKKKFISEYGGRVFETIEELFKYEEELEKKINTIKKRNIPYKK